ncbi:hypothetical protein D3C84_883000 [compost metagenome]
MIDERDQLLAVVGADQSGSVENGQPEEQFSLHKQHPVYTDTPLHDVLDIVAALPYPVPVLDHDGALKGTISKNQLLHTLSRH